MSGVFEYILVVGSFFALGLVCFALLASPFVAITFFTVRWYRAKWYRMGRYGG